MSHVATPTRLTVLRSIHVLQDTVAACVNEVSYRATMQQVRKVDERLQRLEGRVETLISLVQSAFPGAAAPTPAPVPEPEPEPTPKPAAPRTRASSTESNATSAIMSVVTGRSRATNGSKRKAEDSLPEQAVTKKARVASNSSVGAASKPRRRTIPRPTQPYIPRNPVATSSETADSAAKKRSEKAEENGESATRAAGRPAHSPHSPGQQESVPPPRMTGKTNQQRAATEKTSNEGRPALLPPPPPPLLPQPLQETGKAEEQKPKQLMKTGSGDRRTFFGTPLSAIKRNPIKKVWSPKKK